MSLKLKMPNSGYANAIEIRYSANQIRKRISYQFWKPIVANMSWMPFSKLIESTSLMWSQMDDRHNFGTNKQACYDLESLVFCLLESKGKI
ncbi:MAG: hypothetical protein EBY39_07130 [Flavobacteriia bacterium]|nr:hypothetical protein [Flavobacteriia bacterium]